MGSNIFEAIHSAHKRNSSFCIPVKKAAESCALLAGRGTHPAWHLDFVEVHESASNQTWYFPCNQWIDEACRLTAPSSAGANPLLNRELLASVRDPRLDRRVYSLTTFTTDLKAADTDANVTATLYGEKGNSGVIKLVSPSLKSAFQRGQKDTFSVTCQDLGEVTKIRIGHDNTGQSPNWHLTEARLSEPGSGKAWVFPCGQWFDADDGDRQIVRELFARPADSCNYTVTVYTSNIEGAGKNQNLSPLFRECLFRYSLLACQSAHESSLRVETCGPFSSLKRASEYL